MKMDVSQRWQGGSCAHVHLGCNLKEKVTGRYPRQLSWKRNKKENSDLCSTGQNKYFYRSSNDNEDHDLIRRENKLDRKKMFAMRVVVVLQYLYYDNLQPEGTAKKKS